MSLPDAKKVVSENPPKNSVVSPTDREEQEKDVDRKLRFYGVIQAFRQGRMPDNEQIDETLIYVRDHPPIDSADLSTDGRRLVDDTRNLIETARRFVKEKNADEVVQQFVYHTSGAQLNDKPAIDAPVSEKEARRDAQEALDHLRTLFKILVTNSEARKILTDFRLIGRAIIADAAQTVSDRVRPPAEHMEQVDEATPTHKFDENGGAASTDTRANGVQTSLVPPVNAAAAPSASKATTDESSVSDAAAKSTKEGNSTPVKGFFASRFKSVSQRVPDEHKARVRAEFENSKKYLKEQFPKERRDQFVYRLKKVVVECQSHPSYQDSLSWFLSQIETYFGHGKRIASGGANQTASLFSEPLLNQASSEMRIFLERCANGQSMDGMFEAARRMWEDAQSDEELRAWWGRVDTFVRKSLLEPGFILAPLFENQARHLRDESRQFFDVKYREHRDALVDAIQAWFGAWTDDPLNKKLANDWSQLIKDLLFDESGHLTYKPHLWNDIREVILPTLVEKVGYIPIPRIEYTDRDFDLVIENLTLQGRNLFPKVLEITAKNHFKISPYKAIQDENHHSVTFDLSQIQADMKDVAFYYRKKNGLRISDEGLADIFLGGKGISVKVTLNSTTSDEDSIFEVKKVKAKVDTLKFGIHDSKHNLLYKTLRPLATNLVKKQIKKAIQDGIREGLEYANRELVDVRDRMVEAKESEDGSRRQVLKEKFASKKKEATDKSHTTKVKRHSQFRFMPKRDSMLLPDKGHDKGWSQRQYEREDAAAEGEGWRSKAFSIVPSAA